MTDRDWGAGWLRCLGMLLGGERMHEVDENGDRIVDDTLLLLLNAHHEPVCFTIPAIPPSSRWEVTIDTNAPNQPPGHEDVAVGHPRQLAARSLVLLKRVTSDE